MQRPDGERRGPEDGFTIVETVLALGLFVVLIAGLATSTSAGLRLVGSSSTRQTAVQVGSQEIERLRAEGYARLGYQAAAVPVFDADTDSPNNALENASPPTRYNVPDLAFEPLVVGIAPLSTDAGPTAVTRGGQRFKVYRFATFVEPPSAPSQPRLKRLTVVVQWDSRSPTGKPNRVVLSTVFSTGVIAF